MTKITDSAKKLKFYFKNKIECISSYYENKFLVVHEVLFVNTYLAKINVTKKDFIVSSQNTLNDQYPDWSLTPVFRKIKFVYTTLSNTVAFGLIKTAKILRIKSLVRSYKIFLNKNNGFISNFLFYGCVYDFFLVKLLSVFYKNTYYTQSKESIIISQTNWRFYNFFKNKNSFLGIKSIWLGLKNFMVAIVVTYSVIYYLIYIRLIPFNKIILMWVLILMFTYWVLSGFVFFYKKYQFNKYTSSINRFWKKTYMIFWLIEFSTFSVFFYLALNSTSEPIYMFDQIRAYKNFLFSWRLHLSKIIPTLFIIILTSHLLFSLKWNTFNKQSPLLLIITVVLLYLLLLEFYQFYHIINFYSNINWLFDFDEYIWYLDVDTRRTRLYNNYITICLLAKFWHYVFIFIFWVFFLLRVNEVSRVRYNLLSANLQNFIIIYVMSWVYMLPWLKFSFRKLMDVPYFWFYYNNRKLGFRIFFYDLSTYYYTFSNFFTNNLIYRFTEYNFYYWTTSSTITEYYLPNKFLIKDVILEGIYRYKI